MVNQVLRKELPGVSKATGEKHVAIGKKVWDEIL